jgi:MFS family permease
VRAAVRGVVRSARFTGRTTASGARTTGRWFIRRTRADGAGSSGLANLIDLHAVHGAADALLAVALANTLFFAVDPHEARSRVALYLLVTMAPFALVAPVIGPLLDRFRHGRRYALATANIVPAFLAWVMAGAIDSSGGFALYPAAFGALVCSKAYGVTKSAVVPRVLPPSATLVRGNARVTLWGILTASVAAPIGQGLAWATGSPSWTLRLATLVYLAGAVFAIRLPARVDSNEGEAPLRGREPEQEAVDTETRVIKNVPPKRRNLLRRILPPLHGIGDRMPMMLRAVAGLRAFNGFLTLFLAFLVRTRSFGFTESVNLAFIVAAAALGSFVGTTIGARLKSKHPEPLAVTALIASGAIGIFTAVFFNLATATLAILISGLAASIGKLGLDSTIQHDAADDVRTSAFARSETVLQLSWVLGGFLAIVLPSNAELGLALASAVVVGVLALTVHAIHNSPGRGIDALRRQRAVRNADVGQ